MARVTRAAPHLSVEEVKERARTDKRSWCRQRWWIIYNALVDPRPAAQIATVVCRNYFPYLDNNFSQHIFI
jgi:hypothetical protein